jgi:organic hydroperoxide reductase OsmC/OhrA
VSQHRVTIDWRLGDGDFLARRYTRAHRLTFEGGAEVAGTASPSIVPEPYSRRDAVDPEAAFTASLGACHMLWFLDHAGRAGFIVADYVDEAVGTLSPNAAGSLAMTRVVLRPRVRFAGSRTPTRDELSALHSAAHADCFIACSVKTEVIIESGTSD